MLQLNSDDIKLLNIIKIKNKSYKITYVAYKTRKVLKFKAYNIHNKADVIHFKRAF